MKPLLVLLRIVFVGCLWSIIFIEGIRVIMLENWHFDIFWPAHWAHAWNLWLSGWVIDTAKEWAFILIIFTFIPLWLTGWVMLSLIPWGKLVWRIFMVPINFVRSIFSPLKIVNKTPVVVKKKSYKEIRPTGPRTPIYDYNNEGSTPPAVSTGTPLPIIPPSITPSRDSSRDELKKKATDARETFSHALFNLDDEDDDFELDFDSFGQSDIFAPKENGSERSGKSEKIQRKSFDEDEELERNNRRRDEDIRRKDDDYKSRRSRYEEDEDEEDYRYGKSRRRDDDDYKSRRRDDKRYNEEREPKEKRKDNRRDDTKNKNKEISRSPKESKDISDNGAGRGNPVADVLTQKGYKLLGGVSIKNTLIDFVGISADKICLCLVDKEPGDWLADEERFNDEEPLWFSENSHRISPVRKVDLARQALLGKLESTETNFEVKAFVIIQMGNIINAEDMFEIWDELGVEVTRINRGMPKEIKLFSKTVEEAEEKADKDCVESVKKIIRSI